MLEFHLISLIDLINQPRFLGPPSRLAAIILAIIPATASPLAIYSATARRTALVPDWMLPGRSIFNDVYLVDHPRV